MLSLDTPERTLPRSLLQSKGGFAWWYLDAIDAQGDGLVCIWSFGLPFLPGYLSAARAGRAPAAGDRPSVNLVVYRDGRPVSYTLQAFDPADVNWTGRTWTFGGNRFAWSTDGSGGGRLEARLDLAVPGSPHRLTGTAVAEGCAARVVSPDGSPDNAWTPLLGTARVRTRLHHGDRVLLDHSAPGYHDRNGSPRPLDQLGIDHWIWARATLGDRQVVVYLSWPEDRAEAPLLHGVVLDADGTLTRVPVSVDRRGARRAVFGMPWWRAVRVEGLPGGPLDLTFRPPVDDGPFYLRFLVDAVQGDDRAVGTAEVCVPRRIDRDWQRPLVRMCVQPAEGRGSAWLPLFAGPRRDRLERLGRHWFDGGKLLPLPGTEVRR